MLGNDRLKVQSRERKEADVPGAFTPESYRWKKVKLPVGDPKVAQQLTTGQSISLVEQPLPHDAKVLQIMKGYLILESSLFPDIAEQLQFAGVPMDLVTRLESEIDRIPTLE